jgi:hypothetical protein
MTTYKRKKDRMSKRDIKKKMAKLDYDRELLEIDLERIEEMPDT